MTVRTGDVEFQFGPQAGLPMAEPIPFEHHAKRPEALLQLLPELVVVRRGEVFLVNRQAHGGRVYRFGLLWTIGDNAHDTCMASFSIHSARNARTQNRLDRC
jgi:hypothetical protein